MPIGTGLLPDLSHLSGLLGQQQGQFPPAPQPQGGGFLSSLFGGGGDPNYALMALGQGISKGDVSGAFTQMAPVLAAGQSKSKTRQWLINKGMSPEDADIYAANPSLLSEALQGKKRNLVNAGNGQLYDADSGQWITAPNSGTEAKAPDIQELYDENGNAYKAQWNAQTGSWDKMGGVKMTRDKVDEYTRKNRSLAIVIQPELQNLLGDGSTPGKFDALASTASQAGDFLGGIGKTFGGPDLSGYTTGADYQSAKNSLKTIVASYLYSVSGATANPGEVETQTNVLMPRPGEAAPSVAQKKQRIQTMVEAVKKAAEGGGMGQDGSTIPPPDGGVVDYTDYFKGP